VNQRIEIVSDTEVRIRRSDDQVPPSTSVLCGDGGFIYLQHEKINTGRWDAEGRAALRDCINCLEATGSFAALSDESAVPFVGAIRKLAVREGEWLVKAYHSDKIHKWLLEEINGSGELCWFSESQMLPLVPKPKPLTFGDFGDGDEFQVVGKPKKFTKVVTKPFGNECAVDDQFGVYLFKSETPCARVE